MLGILTLLCWIIDIALLDSNVPVNTTFVFLIVPRNGNDPF